MGELLATVCYHMASIYHKGSDPRIWLRYKDERGKWKGKPTSYHWNNIGEVRQANRLAQLASDREAEQCNSSTAEFSTWVMPWLNVRYGGLNATSQPQTTTLAIYTRSWRMLSRFLKKQNLPVPSLIRRDFIERYMTWRKATAGRNTIIGEIKLMGMVMKEAVTRAHCSENPLTRPGLRKAPAKEKKVWSDEALSKGVRHVMKHGSHWMQCVVFLGIYQACRLRQCAIPLDGIRLDLNVIQYHGSIVKGGKDFAQPIDPRFKPILERLTADARKLGLKTLCEVPWDASLRLRKAFDRAGLEGYSHHGLRVTWITRAAENGVPESQAMAFCHHESVEVHRIYKKLSVLQIAHVPAAMRLPSFDLPA